MLEIIDNCPYTNIPEDVYFSNSYSNVSVNKPDFELSKEFSSDQILNPASFGVHQLWYMNKNIEELEKYSLEYKNYII